MEYKKDESYCSRACPADPSAMCGGVDNRVNAYKIESGFPVSTTPRQGLCTASGGNLDGPCIFPWYDYGQWFNECANPDDSARPWCGTKLSGSGQVLKWGYCDLNCFTTTTTTTTTRPSPVTKKDAYPYVLVIVGNSEKCVWQPWATIPNWNFHPSG